MLPIIMAQIGIGLLFIRYIVLQNRGAKEPPKILSLAALLGVVAVIASIFLEKWLIDTRLSPLQTPHLSTGSIFANSMLVGLIEEGAKSIPLAIFIYRRKYFNTLEDGIIYFGISGMIFGIIEDIGYAISLGPIAGIGKIVTGPYIHAGFAVLIGAALAQRKVRHRSWWLVAAGFVAAFGLHGLYDFGLFYGHAWTVLLSLLITLLVNINIFILLKYSQKKDGQLGIAAIGTNYYCRHCGWPNPDQYLYCVYCGNKT